MASLNRVFLIGNLTRDPELRYTPGGVAVASFGLAVNTQIFSKSGGEPKEETCFIKIVVWGKQAESCNQYLKKGRPVFVEGRLVYRSWEQEGKTRTTIEVKADRVQFLGARPSDSAGSSSRAEEPSPDASRQEEPAVEGAGTGAGDDEPPF